MPPVPMPCCHSAKDVLLPPVGLYERTRFSAVFESVVTANGDRDYPAFLTEKGVCARRPRSVQPCSVLALTLGSRR